MDNEDLLTLGRQIRVKINAKQQTLNARQKLWEELKEYLENMVLSLNGHLQLNIASYDTNFSYRLSLHHLNNELQVALDLHAGVISWNNHGAGPSSADMRTDQSGLRAFYFANTLHSAEDTAEVILRAFADLI